MPIVDAQVHIWERDSPERPWAPEHAHHAHRPRYTVDELLADMEEAGVDAALLVPPHSWDAYRNDLVIDAATRWPARFAAMVVPDLGSPRVAEELDALLSDPAVKGIRLAFWDGPSSQEFERGAYDWLWGELERRGTPVAMFVPRHLTVTERIARAHPGLRIALCHLCMLHRQTTPSILEMTGRLLALAALPNVSLKATGLPTPSVEGPPYRDLSDALEALFRAYGPERVFWGTDVTRIVRDGYSYGASLDFMATLPFLDADARSRVMGGALKDWLSWPEAGSAGAGASTPAAPRLA